MLPAAVSTSQSSFPLFGWRGESDAFRVQLTHPVSHGDTPIHMQCFRSWEKREGVPLVAHPGQYQIKARILSVLQLEIFAHSLFVFQGGLFRIWIFAFDPRDLLRFQRRL